MLWENPFLSHLEPHFISVTSLLKSVSHGRYSDWHHIDHSSCALTECSRL